MTELSLATDLARFGPRAPATQPPSLAEAQAYCRELARRHYENFTVASWLLPRRFRPHFFSIYAYCRWADDLADETADPAEARALLDWWQGELDECYRGQVAHPVFVALAETIRECRIPEQPFADLLVAFRQDQTTRRYETFQDLLGYCRNSANPVGHLVLYAGGCFTPENGRLSDNVCTGLQLANFWQDVARDYDRGRIYLPQEDCRHFGYEESMFWRREANTAFHELLRFEVERAEELLRGGWPLVANVTQDLQIDVELFIRGGLAILAEIRRGKFDVWKRRPVVSPVRKFWLLLSAWQAARQAPTAEAR